METLAILIIVAPTSEEKHCRISATQRYFLRKEPLDKLVVGDVRKENRDGNRGDRGSTDHA